MKKLMLLTIPLTILFGNAIAMEELIVYVSTEEAQEVIERNEMQYEEYNWHSFPNRIRIAKINTDLLKAVDANLKITVFDDVLPIIITSRGIDGSKWKGERIQGRVPKEMLRDAVKGDQGTFKVLNRLYNEAELNIERVIKDPQTGEYLVVPANYEELPIGHAVGERFGNVPVWREDVEVITKVYGTIAADPYASTSRQAMWHEYTIKPLYNDVEYVVIFEWDNSKNHHLLEPPQDPEAFAQSEMGQRYKKLREDKADHMATVSERIAKRKKIKETRK